MKESSFNSEASFIKEAPYGIPKSKGGDSKKNDAKMEDCVRKVMAKGHDKSSAIAICKTSLGFTKDSSMDNFKYSVPGHNDYDARPSSAERRRKKENLVRIPVKADENGSPILNEDGTVTHDPDSSVTTSVCLHCAKPLHQAVDATGAPHRSPADMEVDEQGVRRCSSDGCNGHHIESDRIVPQEPARTMLKQLQDMGSESSPKEGFTHFHDFADPDEAKAIASELTPHNGRYTDENLAPLGGSCNKRRDTLSKIMRDDRQPGKLRDDAEASLRGFVHPSLRDVPHPATGQPLGEMYSNAVDNIKAADALVPRVRALRGKQDKHEAVIAESQRQMDEIADPKWDDVSDEEWEAGVQDRKQRMEALGSVNVKEDTISEEGHPVPVRLIEDHFGETAQGISPATCVNCGAFMELHAQFSPTHQGLEQRAASIDENYDILARHLEGEHGFQNFGSYAGPEDDVIVEYMYDLHGEQHKKEAADGGPNATLLHLNQDIETPVLWAQYQNAETNDVNQFAEEQHQAFHAADEVTGDAEHDHERGTDGKVVL